MPPAIVAAIGVGIAAIGTGYSINAAEEAKDKANSDAAKQEKQAKELADAEAARQALEETASKDQELQKDARQRQKRLSAGGMGRRDTILTGPLGVTGDPQTTAKTTLGT